MVAKHRGERTRKLPTFGVPNDSDPVGGHRLVMVGAVIFGLAICALVFQAGWKEIWAHGTCDPSGEVECVAHSDPGAQ
jgi:hypothetical protein